MPSEQELMQQLLTGALQKRGAYKPDMSGFIDPGLQALLVKMAQAAGVNPAEVCQANSSQGTKAAVGDAEHGLKAGLPRWLATFQSKAERSSKWGEQEQAWGRLLGAFFYSYFVDHYYAPNTMAMPANVEYFLLHLGKSNPMGAQWKPTPRPGYVGNGAATFAGIGGGGANYCAAASSKAFLNGLKLFGYQCSASGYAPGGKGVGHGCKCKAQQGRKAGAENRPQPGDVLSIRTAVGPMSGHVITVAWAETDGCKSGEMWYVSGNSMHASVGCDFALVADAAGRPPKGSIAIINRCVNSALQPDKLAGLDAAGLSRLGMKKLAGTFPPANQPGAKSPASAGAGAPPGAAGAGTPAAPGAAGAPMADAPKPEDTLGSGDVQTCAGAQTAQLTVIRVGSHTSEPPPAAAATPSAAGAGGTPAAAGAGAVGGEAPMDSAAAGGKQGDPGSYCEGVVQYRGNKNPTTYLGEPWKKKLKKKHQYSYVYPPGTKQHYMRKDPQGDALISNNTLMARLVGSVGCRRGGPGAIWTKHFSDLNGLDGTTIGFSHFARASVAKLFLTLSAACPEEMEAAFGRDGAAKLNNGLWILQNDPFKDNVGIYRFPWLQQGWLKIARQPWCMYKQVQAWSCGVLASTVRFCQKVGWKTERGLHIALRCRNSGTHDQRNGARKYPNDELKAVEEALFTYKAKRKKGGERYSPRSKLILEHWAPDPQKHWVKPNVSDLAWDAAFASDAETGGVPPLRALTAAGKAANQAIINKVGG